MTINHRKQCICTKKNKICNLHWRRLDDDDLSCSAEIRDDSPMLRRCSRRSDAPAMLTTLQLPTGPVFGPTSEILVLLTPAEQHAHGCLFLETVWLFLLTSNLVASSFHQLAGRCRQRRMSNFWLGDETAVPLCTLVPTSSLVRLSAAPNTEFVDLRLYDWCFLPEYQLDIFHSDSLTPYETFSKKLLWPTVLTSWHLSWMGKWFQGFQVTTL